MYVKKNILKKVFVLTGYKAKKIGKYLPVKRVIIGSAMNR